MWVKHELLRSLRLGRGLTQQEVAHEVEIDIRTYRKYESGAANNGAADVVRASQYETLRGLAALFGLSSPDDLVDKALEIEPALLAALGSVLENPASALNFGEYCALYRKGLLREEEPGTYRIRCQLYEDYFRTLCRKR